MSGESGNEYSRFHLLLDTPVCQAFLSTTASANLNRKAVPFLEI
jgi:hypothetical protein